MVRSLAFSAAGRFAVIGFAAGTLQVLDVREGHRLQSMTTPAIREPGVTPWAKLYSCAWSPDEKLVLAGDMDGLRLWNTTTGRVVRRFSAAEHGPGRCVAFCLDGER